ncbi:MAG: LamG domain-containing protein, partial [Chloroflexi bacterium]|nr:LamG domain-containing protein [Chloroflexota bacterium]
MDLDATKTVATVAIAAPASNPAFIYAATVEGQADASSAPAPVLTTLSRSTATAGDPGFILTVNGSGFVNSSVVRWNGSDQTTTFVGAGELTATILVSDLASAGTPQVSVFTPAPGGGASSAQTFTIAAANAPAAKALRFNGDNSFLSLPDGMVSASTTLTIEAWFQTTSGGVIWGQQNAAPPAVASAYVPVISVSQDGKLRGQFWHGSIMPITSAAAVNDGNWHHGALVAAASPVASQTLYLDGVAVGTLPGAVDHVGMSKNQVGGGYAAGWPGVPPGVGWFPFDGTIDEVRIWNVARSADEIVAARTQQLVGTEPGLAGYWPLSEGGGTTATDAGGHGKTATLTGGPVWVNSAAGLAGAAVPPGVAYVVPADTVGNQEFSGALGMDFDVNTPLVITDLGVFDSGSDGLARPITARLYNRDTQTQVAGLTFAARQTGTLRGGSRFLPLPTAVTLPAGF